MDENPGESGGESTVAARRVIREDEVEKGAKGSTSSVQHVSMDNGAS
jgi:hypothetical protein